MAVSFAIFVPILVLISVAILEFASVGLDYHRAGEATRRGARLATILPPVANLSTLQPSAEVVCTAGDTVPSCSGAALETAATFDAVLASMSAMLPAIAGENIEIVYSQSGLGDATTPGGILPLVQVRLSGVTHDYAVLDSLVPGMTGPLTLPAFSTTALAGGYQGSP
jgi:Flp pilus assembly protein TadG